jgi:hypothetical protein
MEQTMILRREPRVPSRHSPLAAAFVLAGCCASAAGETASQTLAVSMPTGGGVRAGVAALMQALRGASAQQHRGARPSGSVTLNVTSCADDGGGGTLRSVIGAAASGDLVELAALTCSTITLAQGAIAVKADTLAIHGPGAAKLAIDGAGKDRVLIHYGAGTLTLNAVTVRNGSNHLLGYKVAGGACVVGNGDIVLDHATVSGCSAIGEGAYGGAILATNISFYTSTLSGNTAQGSLPTNVTAAYGGGAFAYFGTVALYDSLVSGNRASIDPANTYAGYNTGGGIFADNGGIVLRSTIAGNYTDGTGGGMASHGPVIIANSTISGNTAGKKAGGGLFVRNSIPSAIRSSTITRNSAQTGAGVYSAGTAPTLRMESTIVAGNNSTAPGADFSSAYPLTILGANNLLIGASASVTLPPDTLHADPRLQPLANNGGPTPTHALAPGSAAINHGNNTSGLDTDQRGPGFARVLGSAPDIGAFEAAPAGAASLGAAPVLGPVALALLAALLGWCGARRAFFTRQSLRNLHPSQM